MIKPIQILLGIGAVLLFALPAFAQSDVSVIDASSLRSGDPLSLTVSVSSDENLSFADTTGEITAVLCPADSGADCLTMQTTVNAVDDTVQKARLSIDALPMPGDYTLIVTYFDKEGKFAYEQELFSLTGVRPGEMPVPTPTEEILPTPTEEPVLPTLEPVPTLAVKQALSHQLTLSDGRGNLLCNDSVPCAIAKADDVFTLTYHYPSDWVESPLRDAPEAAMGDPVVTFPQEWADSIQLAAESGLNNQLGNPCRIDSAGNLSMRPQYVSGQDRYKVSCQFTLASADQLPYAALQLHNENPYYQLSDLNLVLPTTLQKSQAVLTPSLSLQLYGYDDSVEQIRSGSISRLYRAPAGFDGEVEYTLKADIGGISAARAPRSEDAVRVRWNLLDQLAAGGALPSCLQPDGSGYILGSLSQSENGWQSECSFYFPASVDLTASSGPITMTLDSSLYQTETNVSVASQPFVKEALYVDVNVPQRFFINFPQSISASVRGADGSLSAYQSYLLSRLPLTLSSSWALNGYGDCDGSFGFDSEGNAACNYLFTNTAPASALSFTADGSAFGDLADITLRTPAEIAINEVSPIRAAFATELYHNGELQSAMDRPFIVRDDYSLKFRLTPESGFEPVFSAMNYSDGEIVAEWGSPLTVFWGELDGGSISLPLTKEGSSFTAGYDFSFDSGTGYVYPELYANIQLPGWDISGTNMVRMPDHVDRKKAAIRISGFDSDSVLAGQEKSFDVRFEGDRGSFNADLLRAEILQNGYQLPMDCASYETGVLSCSFTPQFGNGDGLTIRASYAGDALNDSTETEISDLAIRRSHMEITTAKDFSLSHHDIQTVEAAGSDGTYMERKELSAGSTTFDSYLVRDEISAGGQEYRAYPFNFTYSVEGGAEASQDAFFLDVTVRKGDGSRETLSLSPTYFSWNEVDFTLDFGNNYLIDGSETVRDFFMKAVSIENVTVSYAGDALIGPTEADFEQNHVRFPLTLVSLVEGDISLVTDGVAAISGALGSMTATESFTVYCSQLLLPLNCYQTAPVVSQVDLSAYTDLNGDGIDDFTGEPLPQQPEPEAPGCWGTVRTPMTANPYLFVSELTTPRCYLTAAGSSGRILLGIAE